MMGVYLEVLSKYDSILIKDKKHLYEERAEGNNSITY